MTQPVVAGRNQPAATETDSGSEWNASGPSDGDTPHTAFRRDDGPQEVRGEWHYLQWDVLQHFLRRKATNGIRFLARGEHRRLDSVLPDFESLLGQTLVSPPASTPAVSLRHKMPEVWLGLLEPALCDLDSMFTEHPRTLSHFSRYNELSTPWEKTLFATTGFYREHLTHSVWVYLLGQYLLSEYFKVDDPGDRFGRLVRDKVDTVWCVTALCHDLGFSLEAAGPAHAHFNDILRLLRTPPQFLEAPGRDNLWFGVTAIQSVLLDQVLYLASHEYGRAAAPKCGQNRKTFARLSRLLRLSDWRPPENVEEARRWSFSRHGFAGAYVVYRLAVLKRMLVAKPCPTGAFWSDVLYAIALHSRAEPVDYPMLDLSYLLAVVDELAECREFKARGEGPSVDNYWRIGCRQSGKAWQLLFEPGTDAKLAQPAQAKRSEFASRRRKDMKAILHRHFPGSVCVCTGKEKDSILVEIYPFRHRRRRSGVVERPFRKTQ